MDEGAYPDLSQLEVGVAASLVSAGPTLLSMPSAGAVPASLRRLLPRVFVPAAIEAQRPHRAARPAAGTVSARGRRDGRGIRLDPPGR